MLRDLWAAAQISLKGVSEAIEFSRLRMTCPHLMSDSMCREYRRGRTAALYGGLTLPLSFP